MTSPLSRLLLAGAFLALAALPARAQVATVTDGSNLSNACRSFVVAAGGAVTLTPSGCLNLNTPPATTRLVNISTRMQVLTGENQLIGGFVIGGTTAKNVIVRARGPSLTAAGITNPLANPTLQLFSGQTVIASNDDWGAAANAAAITASGFAPANAQEAAILMTLNPGPYTAIVSGVGATTGVGLVEVFEIDQTASPLVNISTRGSVLTGDDVMIGGFVIQGTQQQTVLIRGLGPSLSAFGIASPLANPSIQLLSGATVLATNDDWGQAANAADITGTGQAPSNPLESAILITLNPGPYTVIVSGVGGTTGVGLVEVFAR